MSSNQNIFVDVAHTDDEAISMRETIGKHIAAGDTVK